MSGLGIGIPPLIEPEPCTSLTLIPSSCQFKVQLKPKRLGDIYVNIGLMHGFEVNLACLHFVRSWGQQEEPEEAILVRADSHRFRSIQPCEANAYPPKDRARGIARFPCQ